MIFLRQDFLPYVAQASLRFAAIFMPLTPKYWDYRHMLLLPHEGQSLGLEAHAAAAAPGSVSGIRSTCCCCRTRVSLWD